MNLPLDESISVATILEKLQGLIDEYEEERDEAQQDDDMHYVEYWEGACRTIYEVATALHIPLDDPWVDPSCVRAVEYEQQLRKARKARKARKDRKEQAS